MKIAYVVINANRREGTSRAVLEVAERLAGRHEVDLIARTTEDANLDCINWRRTPGPGWPEVGDYGSFVLVCDRMLRGNKYDIIHAAGPNCTCADVYTIQTVHSVKRRVMAGLGAHDDASWPRRLTRRLYDQAVLAAESRAYRSQGRCGTIAYLPVSAGTRAELESEYPVSEGLIEEVPNGADLERFHPRHRETNREQIRRRHGLGPNDFIAVFSGGDWVRKGLRIAVDGVASVTDERVKLLVAGDDPLADELRKQVDAEGLGRRVVFAGFQKEVHRYYAAGDVFLFPTAYEAFSLATIEAAASGLPVLMPDISGARELVGTGEAGRLIERNPQSIRSQLEELASAPDRLVALSASARTYVEQRFTWDQIADQTEQVYRRLLETRRQNRSLATPPASS